MSTRMIEFSEELDLFLDEAVRSGRSKDASEVVREGLELLEQRQREAKAKLEWLRDAAQAGFDAIDRGDATTLSSPEDIKRFVNELAAKHSLVSR